MQALINREEVVIPLAKKILVHAIKKRHQETWTATESYLLEAEQALIDTGQYSLDLGRINHCLRTDLQNSKDRFVTDYKSNFRRLIKWLADHYDQIGINDSYLIDMCIRSNQESFVKNLGQQLDSNIKFVSSSCQIIPDQTVVLRNTIHNEKLIRCLLENKTDFWFIDSGYTNFLSGRKIWHRLVPNHIHHALPDREFPADRLHLLESFPRAWRKSGSRILVVENSQHHYETFGTSLQQWRDLVSQELGQHTDRPIEFRPKHADRKTRDSLWALLQASDDIYCVVTDASAAAIEAVWAGIPVITLNQHIANSVARTHLSDINDLYRGDIGNWLCALSYSQFTKKEMFSGKALETTKEYYDL